MSTSTALVASSSPSPAPPEEEAELPVDLSQLPSLPVAKSLVLINNFVANTTRFLNHIAHECEERITRVSDNVTRVEILLAILEAKLNSIPDLNVTDAEVAAAADGNQTLNTNLIDLGISDQDLPSMEVAEADGTLLLPPPPSAEEVVTFSEGMAPPPPPPMDGMDMALIVPPPPPPPPPGLSSPVGSIPPPPPSVMDDFDEDEVKSDGPPLLKLKDDPLFAKYFTMRRLGIPEQVIEHKLIMDGMDTNILHMDPEGPSPSGGVAPTMDAGPQGPILPIMAPPPPQSIGDSDLEDDRIELPPPPPSLLHPKEVERSQSRNIGMPFPPPPPPISPTASIDRPASLFGDGPPVAPPPPPPPPSLSHLGPQAPFENEVESSSDDDIEEFEVDGPAETTGNTGVMKLKDDPAFEKYFKMRKLGLPDGVIQHKLMMDGISLDILDMDPEGPSPNATDGSPAANPTKVPPARPAGGLPPPPVKKFDNAEDDFDSV
ncbi:hypothetical protein PsorP6_001039 [Peronosclerospora sorghi]|uniref:Uncharacterized protein n=1 Tax=Peronosclerospora sorghi TaxID=230839 RepID=A0ACC0WPR1_9STRA|nr:hypothetical protein PsorP6_001039 [Peronosclerospora sorghi]